MAEEEQRQRFLQKIRSQSRSSPAGRHWADFHALLSRYATKESWPPMPLILAASGESDQVKYERLGQQLLWAIENDCFAEAITFLESLHDDGQWNTAPLDAWAQDSYWRP
jgi:hypothetical protein